MSMSEEDKKSAGKFLIGFIVLVVVLAFLFIFVFKGISVGPTGF